MEFNLTSDILFDNIIEYIKNKNNEVYEFEIKNEKNDNETHLKFIELYIDEKKVRALLSLIKLMKN